MQKKLVLKCLELLSFGKSYAKTLNIWNLNFKNLGMMLLNMDLMIKFKRMWEYYFSYCETGFLSNSTDVSHFLLKNKL